MVPRHEGVDVAVGPTVGDALEGDCEPGLRIDAIELGGGQKGSDGGPGSATPIGAGEERILAGDGLGPDGALDGVGVDLDAAIAEEALKRLAAAGRVADGLGQSGFSRDAGEFGLPELEEVGDDRRGLRLPDGPTLLGALPTDAGLDLPESGHPLDSAGRRVREPGSVQLEELAPHMGPAGRQARRTARTGRLDQPVVGRVAIDLDDAGITGQVPRNAVTRTAVFEAIDDHGRIAATERPVVAGIGPQPGGFGLARSGRQGRQAGLVGEDALGSLDPL